jgi:hypothetical protein
MGKSEAMTERNQIPEGEFCGPCPCLGDLQCKWYLESLKFDTHYLDHKRLPICLAERPQIITRMMTGKEGL